MSLREQVKGTVNINTEEHRAEIVIEDAVIVRVMIYRQGFKSRLADVTAVTKDFKKHCEDAGIPEDIVSKVYNSTKVIEKLLDGISNYQELEPFIDQCSLILDTMKDDQGAVVIQTVARMASQHLNIPDDIVTIAMLSTYANWGLIEAMLKGEVNRVVC